MAGFGPSDIGVVLQGVGALAQAAAICLAAFMASNTFNGWRKQKLSERRIEQAERILTAAYKARRALRNVRSPIMDNHEFRAAEAYLVTKMSWVDLDEDRKSVLRLVQGYYNRLNSALDDRRAVDECLPMARALFGETVEKALELLNAQFHIIQVSVDMYNHGGTDGDLTSAIFENVSSAGGGRRQSSMDTLIEDQIKQIEESLLPVLRLEYTSG